MSCHTAQQMIEVAPAPRPPCRYLFSKMGGRIVYFVHDPLVFKMRPTLLLQNKAFLLSTVRRYLNCTRAQLTELFCVARQTLMDGVPRQEKQLRALVREQQHMSGEDAIAFQTVCMPSLHKQIAAGTKAIDTFSALFRMAAQGTESLVSRADFFDHVLPCAKRVFSGALYGQWIDHLLEYNKPENREVLI